ncbi:MAG: metalloregulator ArsR/SmtB family transcription factor [Pseudomonadota bacterium]
MERIFEALSSTPRRRILAYLSEVDLTAGEIAARFDMAQPTISKHLSVLEAAGLVWRRREGNHIRYGLQRETLTVTLTDFLGEVCPPSRRLKKESRALADTRQDESDDASGESA